MEKTNRTFKLDKKLMIDFKIQCMEKEETMSERIEKLIRKDIKKNKGKK